MFLFPYQVSSTEYNLFVCLSDENLLRLREHDPVGVSVADLPGPWQGLRLRHLGVTFIDQDDIAFIESVAGQPDVVNQIVERLTRGLRDEPEDDEPLQVVFTSGGRVN